MSVISQLKNHIRALQADGVHLEEVSRATGGKVSRAQISMWLRGASLSLERFDLLCEACGLQLGIPATASATDDDDE